MRDGGGGGEGGGARIGGGGEQVRLVAGGGVPGAGEIVAHCVVEVEVGGHGGEVEFLVVLGTCGAEGGRKGVSWERMDGEGG